MRSCKVCISALAEVVRIAKLSTLRPRFTSQMPAKVIGEPSAITIQE